MKASIIVDLADEERETLLKLLDNAGSEAEYYIDGNEGHQDTSEARRLEARIEAMYERLEAHVPLTRADVLSALRLVTGCPIQNNKLREDGQRLYVVLKSRCTNALRSAARA